MNETATRVTSVAAANYESIRTRMAKAAARVDRSAHEVSLVVVTKGRAVGEIESLYERGQRDFGENRAQELADKAQLLPSDIAWHFVGPLQTNKVRLVRPVITLLHSLDRMELARAWTKGPGSSPPSLVQVNIGQELQKHGFGPEDVIGSVRRVCETGVSVTGLMAIPPLGTNPEDARPYFRALAQMSDRLRRDYPKALALSMGMTDDFEVAIEEGATFIRVGRAIFDPKAD